MYVYVRISCIDSQQTVCYCLFVETHNSHCSPRGQRELLDVLPVLVPLKSFAADILSRLITPMGTISVPFPSLSLWQT